MKVRILSLLLLLMAVTFNCVSIQAQVTVGSGDEPLPVSVLEIISDYQNGILGGLRLPQLTDAEIENLATEIRNLSTEDKNRANGLIVFNTTTSCIAMWTGTEFRSLCGDIGPAKMDVNCAGIKIFPNIGSPLFTPKDYKQGSVLTANNYIEFPVTVDRRGTYSIAATTGNGYSFESSGTLLEVGDHLLTLRGQGTPINDRIDNLSLQINGVPVASCSPSITVAPSSTFAQFTFDCTSPSSVKVNGNYVKGKALDSSHSIELNVNFTVAGSASFSATGPGITFSGGGTYQPGTHKVVLQGNGTPNLSGNQLITITGYSYTGSTSTKVECSTSVYIVRKIIVMGLGGGIYQPGSADADNPARAILLRAGNFGVSGIVNVDAISIVNGGITNGAALGTKITTENPDIIVIGYDYAVSMGAGTTLTNTINALSDFVKNKKGVLIAFTQFSHDRVTPLINEICSSSISMTSNGGGGTTYQFVAKDLVNSGKEALNAVLDGPFINLVGHSWGEDGGTTSYLSGAPAGTSVLTYHPSLSTRPTAIIHNSLGFIWAGDGGVLAGNGAGSTTYPCKHSGGTPLVKEEYSNGGAYNSFFYANAIAWAIGYVTTNRP